ncbi:MAG: hypothetical protein R3301_15255, partial [Saprospiraceae bacterium]|nr:hypothetical protein [Saprospiraceae bacterium]
MKLVITTLVLVCAIGLYAQGVAINEDNSSPHGSAILDVKSTTKGFLLPRLSTGQRLAIGSPATGLLVYDSDLDKLFCYTGTVWVDVMASGG